MEMKKFSEVFELRRMWWDPGISVINLLPCYPSWHILHDGSLFLVRLLHSLQNPCQKQERGKPRIVLSHHTHHICVLKTIFTYHAPPPPPLTTMYTTTPKVLWPVLLIMILKPDLSPMPRFHACSNTEVTTLDLLEG